MHTDCFNILQRPASLPVVLAVSHYALAAFSRDNPRLSIFADTKPKWTFLGSLADKHPDLALQWVSESNGSHTPQSVSAASNFKAAWRCGGGCDHCGTPHEWSARVSQRSQGGHGCPLCSGHKICRCRSVAVMHPELMEQWDWEGNQGTDPHSVACFSNKKVSWTCTEHGQWDAAPAKRVRGTGCPECGKQLNRERHSQRGFLKDEMPGVYAEIHPTRNSGIDIRKLTCGSHKRVWWLCQSKHSRPEGCQHDHEWEAQVYSRCKLRQPSGCPYCTGLLVCPCNSLAGLQPSLLKFWDFDGNVIPLAKPMDPSWLGVDSTRKVWWRHKCADGQVCRWTAAIGDVARRFKATGRVPCPKCGAASRAAKNAEHGRKLINRDGRLDIEAL